MLGLALRNTRPANLPELLMPKLEMHGNSSLTSSGTQVVDEELVCALAGAIESHFNIISNSNDWKKDVREKFDKWAAESKTKYSG